MCARAMALQGAEMLFYPTAIGSEAATGAAGELARSLAAHSAAATPRPNLTAPVVVSNRIGTERALQDPDKGATSASRLELHRRCTGAKVAEADEEKETVITAEVRPVTYRRELRNN
jgi:N-carbamoylputrescine amidase